jgi:hypothetical protein
MPDRNPTPTLNPFYIIILPFSLKTLPIHIHLIIIYFFYKESVSVDSFPVNIYLLTDHTFWVPFPNIRVHYCTEKSLFELIKRIAFSDLFLQLFLERQQLFQIVFVLLGQALLAVLQLFHRPFVLPPV